MSGKPDKPPETTFERNGAPLAVSWVKVEANDSCPECRERGWFPRVWQDSCPMCYGDDPYGQPSFCASCEYCCGC